MYKPRYLPVALADLDSIVDYIADTLHAPQAAINFIDAVETGVNRLLSNPYICRVYQPIKPVDDEYRILEVKNYYVFYVVIGNIVEIRRVIYSKRDLSKIIK